MSATILCIDDSQTIQQAVEIVFAYEGFQIVKASSGQAALAAVGQVQPNLVLLDSSLPGEDPYQVCQALRAMPNTAQVPIVMMSGSSVPFDADKARAAGSSDQIAKPFESKGLIEKVRQLTGITDRPAPPPAPPKTADLPMPPSAMPTLTPSVPAPSVLAPSTPATPVAARPVVSRPVAAPAASLNATGAQWQPMAGAASSAPPVAAPAVTAPAVTAPAVKAPPVVTPSVAAPAVTAPPVVTPSVAAPAVTAPPVVTPSVAAPAVTAPPVVTPSVAAPAVTAPPVATPSVAGSAIAEPAVATQSSAEKSAFDPFGLSLDDEADDALDISVDEDMGAKPIEMTLEPPPKPGSQAAIDNTSLATPLTDLQSVDVPSAIDEVPPLELTEEMPAQASAAADIVSSEPVEVKPVVTDSSVSESASVAGAPDKGVLSAAIREMVEQVVWEVIPELAETMIREELDRLLRERGVER